MDMTALWIAFGLPLLAAATAAPRRPGGAMNLLECSDP